MCRFHKEGFGIVIYLLRLFESLKKTLEECHIFILIFLIFSASFSSFDIFPKRTYCLAHLTVTFFFGGGSFSANIFLSMFCMSTISVPNIAFGSNLVKRDILNYLY